MCMRVYTSMCLYVLWNLYDSAALTPTSTPPLSSRYTNRYRRNQVEVDRRASKGRKTRYVVHKKLQNFMFPHEAPDATLDVDRLLLSLFQ